ncbi:MAG TPA: SHOCT domain-containing protein [Microthrixaceae bacterium]|nr:SHOCT domain-containing protein [Microthrixaceae bacterium]MCB9374902.1 SHOCT domain-containing protein [Microthrixaceae bacterium]MCB9400955.1 SHOCT domain-containing protein [Microthrixaceae bacterium]MCO5304930.1 SHOCT domain-containing protein [Microthrixaceae bacterium]HMU78906.1 SHOCT domain-containing protein [Microthrixaceae bacterium]
MPGLLRGVARTAAIAGTATAVSGRVQRRQAEKFAQRDANIYAQREQAYEQQVAPQAAPAPAPAPAGDDKLDQLQKLGDLKAQGILTDAEFEAQKAKILAG